MTTPVTHLEVDAPFTHNKVIDDPHTGPLKASDHRVRKWVAIPTIRVKHDNEGVLGTIAARHMDELTGKHMTLSGRRVEVGALNNPEAPTADSEHDN